MQISMLKEFSKSELQKIIEKITEFLTEEQLVKLENIMKETACEITDSEEVVMAPRMSQDFIDEKMDQLVQWMHQIDEGELYLDVEEYEDYSNGYWDSEIITNYYDNQDIGNKLTSII